MTRTAPFGFGRVVFLSHVLARGGPVFPGDPPVEMPPAGGGIIVRGMRIRGGSGSPATVIGLIP